MKFPLVVALVTALAAGPVYAQGGRPANPIYFGVKGGLVDVDGPGFDEATNLGVFVGYTLYEDPNGAFFAEGEYTRTLSDGDYPGGEWDIETLAAYVGYRTAGTWFAMAKAGFGWWDVSADGPATPLEGDDTTFTFGAGGGYRIDRDTGLQVEYTYIDSDINALWFSFFTRF
ncbi:MAG TPA: porin family protein [Burkholderiales bacterium]